jgi:hypothetical protein
MQLSRALLGVFREKREKSKRDECARRKHEKRKNTLPHTNTVAISSCLAFSFRFISFFGTVIREKHVGQRRERKK